MLIKSLALSLMFVPGLVFSAETDHYTLADSEITDITNELNAYSNSSLADILEKLNQEGACNAKVEIDHFAILEDSDYEAPKTSEEKLYEELRQVFANHGKSKLINDFLNGNIMRTIIPLKESVYKEWTKSTGFLLGRDGAAESP
ncbi:MAG: hypothetical protein U9Q34_06715, partial [Elusimicrobiota bacterium]|nr:hypothetical protein [Elusimicrobiota bacterium]